MNMLRWLVALPLLVPACFHPSYDHPRCGSNGECPSGLTCSAELICERGDAQIIDAAPPTACVPGFLDLCAQAPPTESLDITIAQTLDTDSDPRCRTYLQAGDPAICLVYVSSVSIATTGTLTVTGSRPLAIASISTVSIEGAIDVGSHGAQVGPSSDQGTCAFASVPDMDIGGGGGGAGGTFTLDGGDGGLGDSDNSLGGDSTGLPGTHGAAISIATLHGGCRGQAGGAESVGGGTGGLGGHAGGALYVYARQRITIPGMLRATGARGEGGATQAGGGGGGSGGFVVIESPSITITGQLSANGGGGGQGGARIGTTDVPGLPGTDGVLGTTPAAGGFGANNNDVRFSRGGAGGAGSVAATAGTSSTLAGGGGGGGAGVINLLGVTQLLDGSTISPPQRSRSSVASVDTQRLRQ